MANREYGYQYETSPRKLEPDYRRAKEKKTSESHKKQTKKSSKKKAKKKIKMSFEMKFFLNSMLFFSMIFAIIACQTLVKERYKEKESLKQQYNELLASSNMTTDLSSNVRAIASDYGMQTKSATLINLETSDYIESALDDVKIEEEGFLNKIMLWFREIF